MSSQRIPKILVILLALSLSAGAVEKGVLKEFAAARYDKDALIVTSNAISNQFIRYTGGSSSGGQVAPDSEIRLPLDQVSGFILGRHQSLVFRPLEKDKGFKVTRTRDNRSSRRGMTTEEFVITIEADGSLKYGDVTTCKVLGTAGK